MRRVISLNFIVRRPYRRKTRRLRGHNVYAVTEFDRKGFDAVADEFHYLILNEAFLEYSADYSERDVLRSDALSYLSAKTYGDNVGIFYIVSSFKELFDELGAALADRHRTKRSVARMRIASEYHLAHSRHILAHERVDDRLMRRNIYTAVLLRGAKTEHVIVLVDSTAYRAQRIVAVGQHVRYRKFF